MITEDLIIEAKWEKILSSKELIINAYNYHLSSTNFTVSGNGSVVAKALSMNVTQTLNVNKVRNDNEIILFSASYGKALGFMTVTQYIDVSGSINNLSLEVGDAEPTKSDAKTLQKKANTGKIDNDVKTNLDLSKKYASGINDLNYIMDEETILDVTKLDDKTYMVNFDLESTIVNYKTNIVMMNPKDSKMDTL